LSILQLLLAAAATVGDFESKDGSSLRGYLHCIYFDILSRAQKTFRKTFLYNGEAGSDIMRLELEQAEQQLI
jgi:hypothetical protein